MSWRRPCRREAVQTSGGDRKENFDKAFPGDRSYFENEIFSKVKIKVANKMLKMKTELSKDGKYANIVSTAPMSYQPKDTAPKAAAAGKPASAPPANEGW